MRLDHLLSKEHLQSPCRALCPCGGVVRSTPVAQTFVLRRVLTGGISANSGRRVFSLPSTDVVLFGGLVLERCGGRRCGLVFGTLLGPEATGPGGGVLCFFVRDLCFWFPGCDVPDAFRVCGVCGTGLLFENYIVDASIFYKKQFPRI